MGFTPPHSHIRMQLYGISVGMSIEYRTSGLIILLQCDAVVTRCLFWTFMRLVFLKYCPEPTRRHRSMWHVEILSIVLNDETSEKTG